jgi:hypothetical protein
MTIVFVVRLSPGVSLPLILYPRRRSYKEGNRVGYYMITIRTPSLLSYFTYISMDIIIYVLGSTSWSSVIFWMVGRVVVDPSVGLPSPCEVVPLILILVSSTRVISKWVDAGWSGSFLSTMNLSSTQFQELSTLPSSCWVPFHQIDRIGALYRCSPWLSN